MTSAAVAVAVAGGTMTAVYVMVAHDGSEVIVLASSDAAALAAQTARWAQCLTRKTFTATDGTTRVEDVRWQ